MIHPTALAAASQWPKLPADWSGWLAIILISLLVLAGIRRWLKS